MATPFQSLFAALWWGPLRRPFEGVARRLLGRGRRVLSGPARGLEFDGGLAQTLGIYELPVQDALARLLRPGDVVYDIGGHRGFLALLASRCVGPKGRVFVFEPLEENRRDAEEAVRRNGYDALVEVLPFALGDTECEAELFVGGASTVASLVPKEGGASRRVPQTTVDAFAASHPTPSVMKIDVEGFEARVLDGAVQVLASARPRLVIEVHGEGPEAECREILTAQGYRCRVLAARSSRGSAYPRHLVAMPEGAA